MHRYVVPDSVKQRVVRRQGKLLSHDTIEAGRAALVVVDMQNHFVAEGFPLEVPLARAIVPNINRMAKAAVCQPEAARPFSGVRSAASSSR